MSQQLRNILQMSNILDSASSLKLVPIKSLMDKNLNFLDRPQSLQHRPLSESVTLDTPYDGSPEYPYGTSRTPSLARRKWAASMHVMYSIRTFESFLYNPFYSLVFSLRCLGLSISLSTGDSKIFVSTASQIYEWIARIGRYALTGFMLIYILYYAIKTTLTVTHGGIWTNLKVLINAWITLFTVILFLLRHNQIGALMIHIQSINAFVKDHTPPLKKKVVMAIGAAWIYLAISLISFFLDFSYEKSEDLFSVSFGNWQVSPTMVSFILYLDTILSVYFVRGTLIFIIVTYVLLCHSLEFLYSDLKHFSIVQHKQKRQLTMKGLRELRNRHYLLAVYAEELDYIFSLSVFMWYILVLISLCIRVNTIIAGEYSSANLEGWVSSIWAIGVTLLVYLGVSLSASSLTNEAHDSALKVEQLATSHSDNIEQNLYFELILFMSRMNSSPVVLTCYKFIPIQKHFMLIIALIVITYYFFVVHFNNVISSGLCKSS